MRRFPPLYLLYFLLLSALAGCQSPRDTAARSLPAELCYLDTVAPGIKVDLMYAGYDNFVGRPLAGYQGRRAILRRDAAAALARAADILAAEGIGLLVRDAYRPAPAMQDFYAWSLTPDEKMKSRYYPRISKRGIYEGNYIGTTSEHTWGIAVDITLTDLSTGRELDMGGRVDLLDPTSATDYPGLSPTQQANRRKLRDTMAAVGMRNYSKEWWHYYVSPCGVCHIYSFPIEDDLISPQQTPERCTF